MASDKELENVTQETLRFMQGKYCLDQIGDGIDTLRFRCGKKTILTITLRKDRFIFLIILGRAERAKFEEVRGTFSKYIQNIYNSSKTYHDGKWMFIDVTTLEQLEEVKKLITLKKKPNRKPFPKENAFYSKCGHRCDLCIHYVHLSPEFRKELEEKLTRVYRHDDWSMRCTGCDSLGCYNKLEQCVPLKCANEKGLDACTVCNQYPCQNATAGLKKLEPRTILADDITWTILPYVPFQYGN